MIIPKEELTTFQRWQAGSFDDKAAARPQPPAAQPPEPTGMPPAEEASVTPPEPETALKLPTAEEIEQLYEEARKGGYEAGLAEGRAAAEAQAREALDANARQMAALIGNLEQALAEIDQSVADQLLTLAVEIASQVTRGSIAANREVLLPVVREAIAALPLHHAHIVLHLNPADAEHVRSHLGEQFAQTGTQIIEDKSISPGGCQLRAGASEVDATIETRWKRVLESIGSAPQAWQAS